MLTVALNPEMFTSTEDCLPPSPKAPSRTAFRIRWSDDPTQSSAFTSTFELSWGSIPLTCAPLYVASIFWTSTSPTLSAPADLGLRPEGITAGSPPEGSKSFARSGIAAASLPVNSWKVENGTCRYTWPPEMITSRLIVKSCCLTV